MRKSKANLVPPILRLNEVINSIDDLSITEDIKKRKFLGEDEKGSFMFGKVKPKSDVVYLSEIDSGEIRK